MDASSDDRPPIAIGHVTLRSKDVAKAAEFFEALGLRAVFKRDTMAILELRGGTHLLVFQAKGKPRAGPVRSFDFMVDDVETNRGNLIAKGLNPGEIQEDQVSGHRYFEVTDPDGHVFGVYSSHVEGRPV